MNAEISRAEARPLQALSLAVLAVLLMGDGPQQERFVLDPHAGVWLHGPNLPSPRQDSATAVLGDRIYVIGGFGPDSSPTSTTYVMEPAVGTNLTPSLNAPPAPTLPVGSWTTARPIPEAIDHAAAASLGGYIYVAGGTVEKLVTNKFWRYDPIDDVWNALPPLPIPRYDPTMQAFDGKLYVLGGTAVHGNDEKSIEVYDPAARSWSLIQDALGVEREDSRSVLFEGRIAIVGGRDREEHNQSNCDLFNPKDQSWKTCSNMRLGRSDFGLAAVGDQLFAIGGVDLLTGVTTQTTEISGSDAQGWMDGRWLPAPGKGMSVAVIGHTVWVIGGANFDATAPTPTVLRYVIPLVKVRFGGRAGT